MAFGKTILVVIRRLLMIGSFFIAFALGAAATYYFSRGAEVVVPDVVNKSERDAKAAAARIGLEVEVIEVFESDKPPGTVLRQSPAANLVIRKGYTKLKISVSRIKTAARDADTLDPAPPAVLDLTPWSDDLCGILIFHRCVESPRATAA